MVPVCRQLQPVSEYIELCNSATMRTVGYIDPKKATGLKKLPQAWAHFNLGSIYEQSKNYTGAMYV